MGEATCWCGDSIIEQAVSTSVWNSEEGALVSGIELLPPECGCLQQKKNNLTSHVSRIQPDKKLSIFPVFVKNVLSLMLKFSHQCFIWKVVAILTLVCTRQCCVKRKMSLSQIIIDDTAILDIHIKLFNETVKLPFCFSFLIH